MHIKRDMFHEELRKRIIHIMLESYKKKKMLFQKILQNSYDAIIKNKFKYSVFSQHKKYNFKSSIKSFINLIFLYISE